MNRCICGLVYRHKRELRMHIALVTPRWPAARCTVEHYDPMDEADRHWIETHPPQSDDRRFK